MGLSTAKILCDAKTHFTGAHGAKQLEYGSGNAGCGFRPATSPLRSELRVEDSRVECVRGWVRTS